MSKIDLIAAREIVKATLTPDSHRRCHCRAEIDAGKWDSGQKVRAALAGIKLGRELGWAALSEPTAAMIHVGGRLSSLRHPDPLLGNLNAIAIWRAMHAEAQP